MTFGTIYILYYINAYQTLNKWREKSMTHDTRCDIWLGLQQWVYICLKLTSILITLSHFRCVIWKCYLVTGRASCLMDQICSKHLHYAQVFLKIRHHTTGCWCHRFSCWCSQAPDSISHRLRKGYGMFISHIVLSLILRSIFQSSTNYNLYLCCHFMSVCV
jgi:hypothetical protein